MALRGGKQHDAAVVWVCPGKIRRNFAFLPRPPLKLRPGIDVGNRDADVAAAFHLVNNRDGFLRFRPGFGRMAKHEKWIWRHAVFKRPGDELSRLI